MQWTEQEIFNRCKKYAKEYWGLDFNLLVKLNGRLNRTNGRFVHSTGGVPLRLEFSTSYFNTHDEKIVDETIKHELCHWALFTLKKPYKDYDPYFEAEIKRIESHSTRTVAYAGDYYYIYCSNCGKLVGQFTKEASMTKYIQNPKYTTKCCSALVVKNFGDKIETAKERLGGETIWTIKGKPDKGKVILAGRKMLVEKVENGVAFGYLLHQSSLQPQKSLIQVPLQYIIQR